MTRFCVCVVVFFLFARLSEGIRCSHHSARVSVPVSPCWCWHGCCRALSPCAPWPERPSRLRQQSQNEVPEWPMSQLDCARIHHSTMAMFMLQFCLAFVHVGHMEIREQWRYCHYPSKLQALGRRLVVGPQVLHCTVCLGPLDKLLICGTPLRRHMSNFVLIQLKYYTSELGQLLCCFGTELNHVIGREVYQQGLLATLSEFFGLFAYFSAMFQNPSRMLLRLFLVRGWSNRYREARSR